MRTRSQSRRRRQQQTLPVVVENFDLEEPIVDQNIVAMADNRTMAQMLQAPIEGYEDAIVVPPINANNFELKQPLINLVQSNKFTGRQDPHNHLRFFNKVTSTFRHPEVPNTSIKLLLFPFSLDGEARDWLDKEETSRSIPPQGNDLKDASRRISGLWKADKSSLLKKCANDSDFTQILFVEFDDNYKSCNGILSLMRNDKDAEIKSSSSFTLTSPKESVLEAYLEKDSIPPGIDHIVPFSPVKVSIRNPTSPISPEEDNLYLGTYLTKNQNFFLILKKLKKSKKKKMKFQVIQNGNSKKRISTGKDGIVRILSPVTAAEIQAVEKERKAKYILLMDIFPGKYHKISWKDDLKETRKPSNWFWGARSWKEVRRIIWLVTMDDWDFSLGRNLTELMTTICSLWLSGSSNGGDQEAQILAYSQAVKKLEAQIVTFQKQQLSLNEQLTFQANEIYAKDEKLKRYGRIGMKALKEKEQLKKIVDSWKDSSKNLWKLIDSGMSSTSKVGLGRFTKTNSFKGVLHPLTRDYTPKPQEEIDDSLYVYGKKGPQKPEISDSDDNSTEHSTCQSNDSEGSCGNTSEHSSESESESISVTNEMSTSKSVITNEKVMSESKEVEPSCAKHVKTPRQQMKNQGTSEVKGKNWNKMMERELGEGYSFIKKKCFVCGSLSHLIKDCDYYEKKMAREAEFKKQRVFNTGNRVAKPVWTNANRVNHANQFVPRSVQLNAGRPNINSVRPNINTGRTNVNSVRPNINSVRQNVNSVRTNINTVRSKQPVPTNNTNSFSPVRPQVNKFNQRSHFSKSHSPVRRPIVRNTARMTYSHAVKGNWGTAVKTSAGYNWRRPRPNSNYNSGSNFVRTDHPLKNMEDRGIFDSGCSGHMTGNKDHLDDFEECKGGSVTFGGSKGYITGKEFDNYLALADLGASINLMPLSIWKKLGFSADSLVVPLIDTERTLFLRTAHALIDVLRRELLLKFLIFPIPLLTNNPSPTTIRIVFPLSSPTTSHPFDESDFLLFEEADAFIAIDDDQFRQFSILRDYSPGIQKDLKVVEPKKSSLEYATSYEPKDELPKVELKELPPHLEYAFLEENNKLPVIISKEFEP
ncbi:hypothetical protein Tco_0859309 [Tanacetum coccineum]|uniref:CCHC-type domain-containing protein n=1 Tax=Tanacetum coccineum TaxID=301880 RepID=A0ABQ5BEW9_9ASTR